MKAKLLLRIAAAFIFVHLIGHAFGHFTWQDSQGDAKREEVIQQMTENKFQFMGATRSMGDYFEGYSALIIIKYLVFMLLLWAISGFVEQNVNVSRKLIAPLALGLIAFGMLEFVYFFPFAACISTLAGLAAFLSLFSLKSEKS
jgi:hypothetical protein